MGSDHLHLPDLKVTIQSTITVLPSQPQLCRPETRSTFFLSNIDQVLNFNVQTVHFFRANPDFPPETVAEKLKSALSRALDVYNFLGGRMKQNPQTGRLEVDNAATVGAGFVVASSEFALDEIGDLVYPNPGFRQLVVHNMDGSDSDGQPLSMFQVTSFKCGGFAIGVTTNHTVFDGISFKAFLSNLASLAGDKPLSAPPCNDRRLLAARSPPQVTFPHPELLRIPPDLQSQPPPTVFDIPEVALDFKTFRLTSDQIAHLKHSAKGGPALGTATRAKITGFNVVTAHVWRCKALSSSDNNPDRVSTILYAVDIRRRLSPPLPSSYTGNAVLSGYATARCSELEEGPFSKLVEMVTEGSLRMTDEYVRSVIDWGEVNKGFPNGEAMISSWWRLGFNEVEYPWGKPLYSCPVVYHRKDIILYFPDMSENGINGDEGVNVLVALPPNEMRKFDELFHKFLGMTD